MRIGIDGNLLCGKKTGMGTVVYHVLENFANEYKDVDIILYVPEQLEVSYLKSLERNHIIVIVLKHSNYMIWEQLTLRKQIKKDKIDIFWFPYNTGTIHLNCKFVVTINDVIYMKNPLLAPPTIYKKIGQLYRKIIVPIVARNAQSIITISNYAKNEIISVFPNVGKKTKVIYLSADNSAQNSADSGEDNGVENGTKKLGLSKWKKIKLDNKIQNHYILGFGSLEKRKNSLALVKAFAALPQMYSNTFQLVLFGFRGWKKSEEYRYVKEHRLNNVVFLGYVTEQEKNCLYDNSKMFVFPSLSEGFGIPILEAFVNTTPVITSNTTSLPEVAGDAAVLIDPHNIVDITDAILRLLENESLCHTLKQKGLEQYAKFDWSKTAEAIMNTLLEANLGRK